MVSFGKYEYLYNNITTYVLDTIELIIDIQSNLSISKKSTVFITLHDVCTV